MEHNDNEQLIPLNRYQQPGQADRSGDAGDPAAFVPAVLARLGLSSTTSSPAAEEQGLEALHHPAWSVRLQAVQHTERLAEPARLAVLLYAIRDEHENVRVAAARALGSLASQEAAEALTEALRDPAWTVRAAAALELGRQQERTPPGPLVAALHDEDATVRASVASALGTMGEQAPLALLFSALFDPAWTVRESAVLALGEIGARVPAALFLTARVDRDEPVRQAAELVLRRLYPELLADDATSAAVFVADQRIGTHARAKLNGYGHPSPEIIQPGPVKQQPQPSRRATSVRKRFFPRIAALVAAALLLIATLFSWLAFSHGPQGTPPSHAPAFAISGISSYRATGGPAFRVAWSPEGSEIASTNAFGLLQVRDVASGRVISTFQGDFLKVLSLAWLPDHALLLAAQAADKTVQVWNVLTKQPILITPPLQGRASTATWSPDGSQVAFDGGDATVQVWNIVTGTMRVIYKGHQGRINALSWSPDGTEIASASDDQTVQVWNAVTGHKDWPSFVHTNAVSVVAWSPNNTRCAVATDNGTVEVWDNPSWNKTEIARATVGGPALNPPLVAFLAWSPDAAHLAFAISGGPLQVWDVSANHLLYTYPNRNGQVNNVAWSPDGTHIAAANANGMVQILPIPNDTTVNERLPH